MKQLLVAVLMRKDLPGALDGLPPKVHAVVLGLLKFDQRQRMARPSPPPEFPAAGLASTLGHAHALCVVCSGCASGRGACAARSERVCAAEPASSALDVSGLQSAQKASKGRAL